LAFLSSTTFSPSVKRKYVRIFGVFSSFWYYWGHEVPKYTKKSYEILLPCGRNFFRFCWRYLCNNYSYCIGKWKGKTMIFIWALGCSRICWDEYLKYPPFCYYPLDNFANYSSDLWSSYNGEACIYADHPSSCWLKAR